jgi:hypothetical protein
MVGVVHIGKAAKLAGVSVDTIRFTHAKPKFGQ